MAALAQTVRTGLAGTIDDLNVYDLRNELNATPPAVDFYPADPFYEQIGYGHETNELAFTVRARVAGDDQEQQKLLIRMMDPSADESVTAVLHAANLGGTADYVAVSAPSEQLLFADPSGTGEGYLGCTWRARVGL